MLRSILGPFVAFASGALLVAGIWLMRSGPDSAPVVGGGMAGMAEVASDALLGDRIPDFAFHDVGDSDARGDAGRLAGSTPPDGRLSTLLEDGPVVVVMRDTGCPVCRKYGHETGRLEAEYAERGVDFIYLNVSGRDTPEAARAEMDLFGFEGSYILDHDEAIRPLLQPLTTTEVFLIDRDGILRYRGAIDDQYGIDFAKPEPRHRYLRDALDAVLAGEAAPVSSTFASGCFLAMPMADRQAMAEPITWHNRIRDLTRDNCVTCHREGGVAPFSLTEYETAKNYRGMIQFMVGEGRMPPWFAAPEHGTWANDRSLDPQDKLDLLSWVAAGAPLGTRPDDAPPAWDYTDEWTLGTPDAVVEAVQPFAVPAEGVVDYQYFYVKTDFPEDRWVTAMEVLPTQPQVVHHVLVFEEAPDTPGREQQGGVQGYFAATAPGFQGNVYPDGAAKRLPAGGWLKFQVHYTPNGTPVEDVTRLGLHFADGPPERVVETSSAFNTRFEIPPGDPRHEVVGRTTFRRAGEIIAFFPHMHLRGIAYRYEMLHPDGRRETLLDIPRYDFNWQLSYLPSEPIRVEPGMELIATGWFDNSAANPANPDPTATVRFGEQTFDEMQLGYFDWIPDGADASTTTSGGRG